MHPISHSTKPLLWNLTKTLSIYRVSRLLIFLLLATTGRAVMVVPVDWLTFMAGGERTRFALLNDSATAFAQAEVSILSGGFAPFSPSAGLLESSFWVTTPGFLDSTLGTDSVATTKLQVAPLGGAVNYQLNVTGADLSGTIFAIGQFFATGTAGTRYVDLSAMTAASTPGSLNYLGLYGWDDGIRLYTQLLTWDSNAGRLSVAAGASGESAFAFFQVQPAGGAAITQLTMSIPNGYNGVTGDTVEVAFGIPAQVPEPHAAWLLQAGALAIIGKKRGRKRFA